MAYEMNGGSGAMYHRLTMEGREKLTVGGVEDVERFDESCIVMSTCAGTLVVTGEGLHIGKLSLDGGEYTTCCARHGSWTAATAP